MKTVLRVTAALALASTVAFFAGQTRASTFAVWEFSNVPWGDTLDIRKYVSISSQKQAAYPNGTVLQMTGKCAGGLSLFETGHLPDWNQKQRVRYRWCQIWHDPAQDGQFVTGWVYGRYIAPY